MGQCHDCRRKSEDACVASEKVVNQQHSGSDSALDSSHSGGDEHSYLGGGMLRAQSGRSLGSQSSGKYSLRDSTGSCCDVEPPGLPPEEGKDEDDDEDERDVNLRDSLQPLQDIGARRLPHVGGSYDSIRGSVSPTAPGGKDWLGRSASLKIYTPGSSEIINSWSWSGRGYSGRRSLSLRLPRRSKKFRDGSALTLPTITVEDPEATQRRNVTDLNRKISLKRAFSLLNVNSLGRGEGATSPRSGKPVQKILRQPRRRHNTVRGVSGMAIDSTSTNQQATLTTHYYPTRTATPRSPRPDAFVY